MSEIGSGRIGRLAGAVALVVAAASVAACGWAKPASLPVLGTLPGFVLEDQEQQSIDLADLRGAVWVADFLSTKCKGPCEAARQRTAALAKEIASNPALISVKLVSFAVDPDADGVEVLRDYARTVGADAARWMLLTGTRDAVRRVVDDGFHLAGGERNNPAGPLVESQSLVLVDRLGRVRARYDALDKANHAGLLAALAALSAEQPTEVFVPRGVREPYWLARRSQEQIASAGTIAAPHEFRFSDRIGASGITFRHGSSTDVGTFYTANHYDHGTGVAVADVDGDGFLDLYFANQAGSGALFRNIGGGRFNDVTNQAGLMVAGKACVGAFFGDIDNDGDADLYLSCVRDGNLLFENDGRGWFKDITASAGVAGKNTHSSGAVFFDYDSDGRLDLFVANVGKYTRDDRRADGLWSSMRDAFAGHLYPERSEASVLYRNLGGGRFEDASVASGLVHSAWSGEATAFDADGDGRPDLYVASMQGHDEFWRNLGGGRFERRSRQVFPATPWGAMGLKVLDWNGDGRFDLFVTDMHTDMSSDLKPEEEALKHDPKTFFPPDFLGTDGKHVLGNALFTNQGAAGFVEESDAAGAETGWPWGPSSGDLNADGWPDIFVAAGMNYPFRYRGTDVLLNEGGTRFAHAEYVLGIEPRRRLAVPWFNLDCDGADAQHDICQGEAEPLLAEDTRTPEQRSKGPARHGQIAVWAARASRSAAIVDIDNDGDLDIVTSNYGDVPQVFISDLSQRGPVHFLRVKLTGRRSNRDGIGAVVTVTTKGRRQVQVNDGESGYLAQSVMPLYVGLGAAYRADSITVKWPSGIVQTVRGSLQSGAVVEISEP